MSTKRNGVSCYDKADQDEPIFVLRSTDRFAPHIIRYWASLVIKSSERPTPSKTAAKVIDAHYCASAMEEWQVEHSDKVKIPD